VWQAIARHATRLSADRLATDKDSELDPARRQ
jgi:hypothetical protein